MKVALQESVKGIQNGDVNLGDGRVAALCQDYDRRGSLCQGSDLKEDMVFLEARLQ